METDEEEYDVCMGCYVRCNGVYLPCQHPMCESCATKWVLRAATCPMCRRVPESHTALKTSKQAVLVKCTTVKDWELVLEDHPHGVRVKRVSPPRLLGRITKGSILSKVDGFPLARHDVAIALIEKRIKLGTCMSIEIHPPYTWLGCCFVVKSR